VHYFDGLNKVYKGTILAEADEGEVVNDQSGYIGVFHRQNVLDDRFMKNFSMEHLANLFVKIPTEHSRNEILANIMRTIK
jgi:hypothetical protein